MAKKIFGMILALMMLLSLAACGQAGEASAAELSAAEPGVHGKTLIVYFPGPPPATPKKWPIPSGSAPAAIF